MDTPNGDPEDKPEQGSVQSDDTGTDFDLLITVTANEDTDAVKIPYPTEVQERVSYSGPKGKTVYWNYDREWEHIVLSDESLRDGSAYQNLGESAIYDSNDIRPPQNEHLPLQELIEPGDRLVYLSHSDMIEEEVSSVYLLWGNQHLDMLESRERRKQLLQVPNFLK